MPESVIRENLEMSDLDNTSAGNAAGKRQNLAMFPSLVRFSCSNTLARRTQPLRRNLEGGEALSPNLGSCVVFS